MILEVKRNLTDSMVIFNLRSRKTILNTGGNEHEFNRFDIIFPQVLVFGNLIKYLKKDKILSEYVRLDNEGMEKEGDELSMILKKEKMKEDLCVEKFNRKKTYGNVLNEHKTGFLVEKSRKNLIYNQFAPSVFNVKEIYCQIEIILQRLENEEIDKILK